ncbi:MAG: ankyrin repeat domain-containing protein [Planctomycetes bacterium]|nr:ankyrin repeat domain-containing protein [Planctomycetota bacterium]
MDIWSAAAAGNLVELQIHVEFATDLESVEPFGGGTPLMAAALYGQTGAVDFLLKEGALIDATNREGSTALHAAAFFCQLEVVNALLASGADPDVMNQYGQTPQQSVSAEWNPGLEAIYKQLYETFNLSFDVKSIQLERSRIAEAFAVHAES